MPQEFVYLASLAFGTVLPFGIFVDRPFFFWMAVLTQLLHLTLYHTPTWPAVPFLLLGALLYAKTRPAVA